MNANKLDHDFVRCWRDGRWDRDILGGCQSQSCGLDRAGVVGLLTSLGPQLAVERALLDRFGDVVTAGPGFDNEHFVYACPLCHPAFEAFCVYRRREMFFGLKAPVDTFGSGLDQAVTESLRSNDPGQRRHAIEGLINPWVSQRLEMMRLTGHTPVLNTFSQSLYEIHRETVSNLLPEAELLLDATKGNPWEERLNQAKSP